MSTQIMSPGELEAQLEARLAAARARPTAVRARPVRQRTARRPRRLRAIATLTAVGALTILGAAVTLGVHDAGFVEMDGNVIQNAAVAPPYDWNTLFNSSGTYIGPAGHQNAFAADYATPDYTYHAGSDKDQDNVTTWQCGDVNNPTPKDEILNAYAVLSIGTSGSHVGDTILNFGFERPVNNGTSFMGVWFFQSAVGCDSSPSGTTISFDGAHSDGDILTLVNFTNGGAQFSIQVYEWVGTGGAFADGTMDLITSSGECGPSEGDARVCGKVNTASITTNWPPGDGGLAANQFFEGGLNINDLLAPEGQSLPCFSTFMAETRTSDVFTAQLKDFAFGSLNSCGEVDAHKYLDVNGNGSLDPGEGGLDGWTIDLYKDDGTTAGVKDAGDTLFASKVTSGGGDAAFTDVPAGDYIICEQLLSASPPWVNTDPGSASAAGPLCKAVTVTAGLTSTTNFGNGQPNIHVTKTPNTTNVCAGKTVTYTYVVENTGNVDLSGVSLSDNKLGTVGTLASLAVGASHTFTATSGAINGTVTNTVTATGNWDDLIPAATATASATVTSHLCTISLTKTPNKTSICSGSSAQVTYTYVITNNSDFFGVSGTLTDDQFGSVGSFGPIAHGATQTLTKTVTVNGTVTNIGTASGTFDDSSSTTAQATATATVTAHLCTISLTKTPSTTDVCNDAGSQVTYTYVITNESDTFNVSGTLTDDKFGSVGSFGPIVPLGSQTLTKTVTVNGTVTNIGTASGTFDDSSSTTAQATATATVTGHDCTISLTKTPDQTSVCNGTLVTYTYVITNNSDFFTWTGTLTDDKLGAIDGTIVLGPGGSQTFTASTPITGDVINIATASGTFDDDAITSASAQATAEVVGHPCGQGCTPGFWQGGVGITLWNTSHDLDWQSHGGASTWNPFVTTDKFNSFFLATGNITVDNMTMLEIVGSGGTNVWARKAARDLIAAYLNSSFLGSAYPYSTATILADWATAVAGGTAGFQAFHAKYSAANELGCTIGNDTTVTLAAPNSGLLALASVVPIIGFGVLRRRRRR
jgi:hypothetical protein